MNFLTNFENSLAYSIHELDLLIYVCYTWGKIRQVYPPKNFLSPISLKVREIIVLVNLF